MIKDLNKDIYNIDYNYLNLPERVYIDNSSNEEYIDYIYDAAGNKLAKKVYQNSNVIFEKQYVGNAIFERNIEQGGFSAKMLHHTEGAFHINPEGGFSGKYSFNIKDHLGNIRMVFGENNGSIEVYKENNYYPFGLTHKGYNGNISSTVSYLYGYNGKEENDELGLKWLDFGARNYDAALGRWMNIDPLAEKYYSLSPYQAMGDNPILYVDPDGKKIVIYYKNESYVYNENAYLFNVRTNDRSIPGTHKFVDKNLEAIKSLQDQDRTLMMDNNRKLYLDGGLMGRIINSRNEYKIYHTDKNDDGTGRIGARGIKIYMNLTSNSRPRLRTTQGRRRSNYKYTLAHEIGHVFAQHHNMHDSRPWLETQDGRVIRRSENFAMHFENHYREYDRTHYNEMDGAEIYSIDHNPIAYGVGRVPHYGIVPYDIDMPFFDFDIGILPDSVRQEEDRQLDVLPQPVYPNPFDH